MSLFRPRILATSCLLAQVLLLAVPTAVRAAPATPAADTWQLLATPPSIGSAPIFALAVDPTATQSLLVGTASGDIYRSEDGGGSWQRAASHLGKGVLSLAFVSGAAHVALAGTRGDGIWRSADAGATWQQDAGTAGRTVRGLDGSTTPIAAGTEAGVLTSSDGISWHPAGLASVDVATLAVLPGNGAGLVAGGDSEPINTALPLYTEHGSTTAWHRVSALLQGSSTVDALSVVAASQGAEVMMGTDAGAFSSRDGGASWAPISGYGSLPATDVSAIVPVDGTAGLYYVASDGGGSSQGGLWVTRNDGARFRSLDPPQRAVTALAAAGGAQPVIYAAGFAADHGVRLWSFTDAGGTPHAAVSKTTSKGGHRSLRVPSGSSGTDWLTGLATGPEAPFVIAFAFALLLLIAASAAYVRGARRL